MLALPAVAAGQGRRASTLVASVVDAETGIPIAGAEVRIPGYGLGAHTDSVGEARIANVPSGAHRVVVRRIGYTPLDARVAFGGDQPPEVGMLFLLQRAAQQLDTVRVTEAAPQPNLTEFERRRQRGLGHFFTEAELGRAGTRAFDNVLLARIPGIRVVYGKDLRTQYVVSTRWAGAAGAGGGFGITADIPPWACPVHVYLDGIFLSDPDISGVRTNELAGVEFYSGATIPAEYRRMGAQCGVLLLWSKW